jgi:Zn-finger nucleic acid-binding protein
MSERGGVEIDYCPQCRGVWLDRGELDKIIDRVERGAAAPAAPPAPAYLPPPLYNPDPRRDEPRRDDRRPDDRRDRPRHDQPRYDDRRRPKKKEGWLGELFDF